MQIPKNVVQTGKVDACHKIYIEDYVHTFLKQYQKKEADFCLYGTCETEGGVSCYFLYGAAKEEPGWEMMENRYFSGYQRIGEATFDGKDAWFFFEDDYSAAMDGYFIFYEQNEDMQSYLIAMHQNQPGEKAVEVCSRHPHSGNARTVPRQTDNAPRRIHRKPLVYDLPSDRTGLPSGQPGLTGEKQAGCAVMSPDRSGVSTGRTVTSTDDSAVLTGRSASSASRAGRSACEKALHAAQAGERQRRIAHAGGRRIVRTGEGRENHGTGSREGVSSIFPAGRGTVAALLMILCAVAVVSLSRPEEMREAGNFFAEAARELDEGAKGDAAADAGTAGNGSDQGDGSRHTELLVEERQLSDNALSSNSAMQTEMAMQTETETLFPIFTADLGLAESSPAETTDSPTQTEEAEAAVSAPSADQTEQQATADARVDGTASEETTSPKTKEAPVQETAASETAEEAAFQDTQDTSSHEVSAQPASYYVIQNGDNLAAICRRQYGSTDRMEEIASLNGLADPNHLIPGQEILLPQ